MLPVRPFALVALASLSLAGCASAPSRPDASGANGGARARASQPRWLAQRGARPLPRATRCPEAAVLVPGGSFTMGSPEGQGAADEHPQRPVTLRAYCLDRLEVTADAYARCVAAGACTRNVGSAPDGALPVTGVDWEQALSYCRFVGGRLPTEAEWEFAARGTDGRAYPWGNDAPSDCARLDWTHPEGPCNGVGPSRVGSSPAGSSALGVLDMAGNVWEWTADWYARSYPAGAERDPTGPRDGSARVVRGGGWNNDQPERLRATFREGQHPAFHDFDLGVRCAYDPAP